MRDAVGRLNRVEVDRYPDLASTTAQPLVETYAPERDELARLLGRDLREWQV